jgi:uncharacterized integral membrane protein
MIVVYLLVAMLGAAVAFFTIQNAEPVALTLFHWRSAKLPLSLLMLFSALAGVLLAALSGFAEQVQLHRRIRYLERRFTEFSDVPPPPPARVEAAPERMPERTRV